MSDSNRASALAPASVLDDLPEGVLGLDADWRVAYANDRAADLLGVADLDGVRGRPLWSAVSAVADTPFESVCRDALDAGDRVERHVSLPGVEGPVDATVTPRDGGLTVRLDGPLLDPEDWMGESLARRLVDTGPFTVLLINADGEVVHANERAGDKLGFDADDPDHVVGDSDVYDADGNLVPPEERPYARLFEEGGEVSGWECQVDLADGSRQWVSIDAAPVDEHGDGASWVVLVATDITERKTQERRLQRERDELRDELSEVFERVTDAFFALDRSWEFTYVNDRAAEVLDASEEELLGQSVWDTFRPAAGTEFERQYREAMETQESSVFEAFYEPLDAWFRVHAYPSETGLSVHFRDVTERKARERELERYRTVLEAAEDGVYVVDEDGYFLMVNERYAELTGRSREQLLDSHVSDVVDEETAAEAAAVGAALLADEDETRSVVTEINTPDGTIVAEATFALADAPDGGYHRVGIVRDITGREQRQRELERYETIVETVRDGIYVLDENSRFVSVNEAFCDLVGYDREALLGEHATLVADRQFVDRGEEIAADLSAEGHNVVTVEEELTRADGSTFVAENRVTTYAIDDETTGRIGTVRDVTERKERESRLREQREDLERLVDISAIAQRISREALSAESRDEIERLVVERLADAPYYDVAWFGAEVDGDIVSRAGAGAEEATLADLVAAATDATDTSPVKAAYRRDSVQVRQNVPEHPHDPRRALFEDAGLASTTSLPIADGDAVRGVLTIHTAREHAFSGTERDVLRGMADTVATAIQTVEHRQRYRSLVDDVLDTAAEVGISVVDEDGTVVWLNDAVESYFGVDRRTVVGESVGSVVENHLPPALHDPDDALPRLAASHDPGRVDERTELHVAAGAGRAERYLEHRAVRVRDGLYAGGWVDIFTDVTERRASEEALAERERRYRTIVQAVKDYAIFMLDPDGTVATWNVGAERIKGYDHDEIVGQNFACFYPEAEREARVPEHNLAVAAREGRLEREGWRVRADGTQFWAHITITALYDDGELTGFSKVTRDMTERRERERELERLSELNGVIRRLNQALVNAESHEEIEEVVCERLVEWSPFVFAWYGEATIDGESAVDVTAHAGREAGYLSTLDVRLGDDPRARGPAGRAIERDEVVVAPDLATDGDFEPWREAALERGYRSSVAIPVRYGDARYGIIGLYSDEPEVVSEEERRVLAELGETIGHAKNAILRKEGLVSDTVVQLDLSFDLPFDPDAVLSDASREDDATLLIDDTVLTADGTLIHYATAEGFSEESIAALVEASPTWSDYRRVEGGNEDRFEIRQTDSGLVDLLAAHGGRVRAISFAGDRVHVVVELPHSVEIRDFVDTIKSEVPRVELDAQRTVEREDLSDWQLREAAVDALTEKQRTALEVAFFAGYFEWPRDSDGEVVADTLGISPSTFHQHLRAGERKLLAALFEK